MPLIAGHRIGPFEILSPLGAGGMGEVYRARDTRLGRDVAIKSLPPGFASDPERLARFEREARLLASLSHPNIAGIHGLEDAGGTPYLVLEIVEGETLAQRLARGVLPVREALEVGGQIAAAIEAAHERGIVHRDLKPGNVMISAVAHRQGAGLRPRQGRRARGWLLDRPVGVSPTLALSATGSRRDSRHRPLHEPGAGARASAVDRRADVWAFGCVLYECLSGRPCVRRRDGLGRDRAHSRARAGLERAAARRRPKRLTDLVRRCLTKDLDERPRDIGDLRRELSAIAQEMSAPSAAMAAPAGTPSLAVLYFENLARDPDSEYFCAGITEDILTDLSKIKGLRVVVAQRGGALPRRAGRHRARSPRNWACGAVLEGSVRRAGDRVRISAQLINAADGFHLWAERYDRTLDDVFAVQEEIASSIAEALRVALSPAETAALVKDRPQDVRAYDLYLKGRELYGHYNDASLREALALFQQATEIDPGYALAWAGISDCYGQLCQWGKNPDIAELTRLGLEAARHAISLDSRLPDAYKAEALNLKFAGDSDGSRAALERAVEVNPRFTPALLNLAVHALCNADLAGTERYVRRALQVDPQEAFGTIWLGWLALMSGRTEETLAASQRIRKLTNARWYVTTSYGLDAQVHLQRGDLAAAEKSMRDGLAQGANTQDMQAIEAMIAAKSGRMDEARVLLARLDQIPGLTAGSLQVAAGAALRVGDRDWRFACSDVRSCDDLAPAVARLDPDLHGVLDLAPFAPRRWDVTLVWPLEAPMIDAACFALFREVRIESGRPAGQRRHERLRVGGRAGRPASGPSWGSGRRQYQSGSRRPRVSGANGRMASPDNVDQRDRAGGASEAAECRHQRAGHERPGRGQHAPDVETESRARGAQARGVELRQVDGEAAEDSVVEEAEQRQQRDDVPVAGRREKRRRQHHQAARAHHGERRPAPPAVGNQAETQVTGQRTGIEQHGGDADARRLGGRVQRLDVGQRAHQRRGPVRRAPQAEDRHERQRGAGPRAAAQRGGEQFGESRASRRASGRPASAPAHAPTCAPAGPPPRARHPPGTPAASRSASSAA